MRTFLKDLAAWLKTYESLAVWLEGIALVAILVLDWRERIDQRKERQEQHSEMAAQMDISRRQVDAATKSADAATEAALMSKKSTEILTALHRPFMGLFTVRLDGGGPGFDEWIITFVLKNFGGLPALEVGAMIEFFVGDTSFAKISEPASIQVFPSFETQIPTRQIILRRVDIQNGKENLLIKVRIPYKSDDGRHFEYASQVSFNVALKAFNIDSSDTHLRFTVSS